MKYQICNRCIVDTTVSGATFDAEGICNFCRLHDKLEKVYPLGETGKKRLQDIVLAIKQKGRVDKYDCLLGLSGGRDSTYTLYLVRQLGLRPLAVHFNDGFGNPIAGENMKKATEKLNVELRTVTSDWRESRDLKIAFLKASTPDLEEAADLGIANSLYMTATKENIKYILIGQSFRTEGIAPLSWNFLDGKYLKNVHREFGSVPLKKWRPQDPGFNLSIWNLFYYTAVKGIKTIPILYYVNYVRKDAEEILKKELGWVYPGAHYYDDLYQSLMTYVYRIKFNIDRRIYNYSALIRSGQMPKEEALEKVKEVYVIEDPKIIELCIKRLGLSQDEFNRFLKEPVKTFRDYRTSYNFIKMAKPVIKLLSKLEIIPSITFSKYFECG